MAMSSAERKAKYRAKKKAEAEAAAQAKRDEEEAAAKKAKRDRNNELQRIRRKKAKQDKMSPMSAKEKILMLVDTNMEAVRNAGEKNGMTEVGRQR